jgi:hypothetical protein
MQENHTAHFSVQSKQNHTLSTTSHPPPPILLRRTRRPPNRAIISDPGTPLRTRHQHLSCLLGLVLDIISQNLVAAAPHKRNQRDADEQRGAQQNHVDGDGIVVEGFVCCGVEGGLGEVEQAGETDDEAVDFAEGGEAEDFGGVVAGANQRNIHILECWGDLRDCGVV